MKKSSFIILVLSVVMLASCKNAANTNDSSSKLANKFDNQGKVMQTNKLNFLDVIMDYEKNPHSWVFKGEKPCVVDFYADWCKPCKMVAPIMEELAKEYEGKINIYKVNIDNEKELAQFFQIESIPAILFVPQNGIPSLQAGAMSKEQYKLLLDGLLSKQAADTTQKAN
ncbi:MAG: thioredoxin [Bacteroidales bacterium]